MELIPLSTIDLYHGTIDCPQGFEIDRKIIKNSIIQNYVSHQTLNKNPLTNRDFKVDFSQPLQWLQDHMRDYFREKYGRTLVEKNKWATVLEPNEQSYSRNTVDPVDLRHSPDYTFIYGVDVSENSCQVVCHYNDNRRAGKTWHIPMKNNKFIMFPSTQKYFITSNQSKKMNIFLIVTYEYV